MTVILKPAGRGKWHEVTMQIVGARAAPLLVRPGATFTLGGVVWRVCRVEP